MTGGYIPIYQSEGGDELKFPRRAVLMGELMGRWVKCLLAKRVTDVRNL
jgi:hypothetical protein